MKLKLVKSYKLVYGDPFNSVTTDGQILNTTIELFLEIKHLSKFFTKSTFTIFAHLNRLSSKEIYSFLIAQKEEQTASRLFYQKKFSNSNLDCKNIYLLVHIVTKDSKLRAFQCKLLNNVLYLNKMLFKFGKSGSPLCCFSNLKNETPYNLFYEFSHTISLRNQLRHFLI